MFFLFEKLRISVISEFLKFYLKAHQGFFPTKGILRTSQRGKYLGKLMSIQNLDLIYVS